MFYGNSSENFHTFENESYREAANIALAYYPELKNCRIKFVDSGKSKIAHQAIPSFLSCLKLKKNRTYLIRIASDQYGELDSTLFQNLEFESQVGVLGHELAHILDYNDESSISILFKGLKYQFSKTFRTKYERETNEEAISRDLGSQILSWSKEVNQYLLQDNRNYYHSPLEVELMLDSLKM